MTGGEDVDAPAGTPDGMPEGATFSPREWAVLSRYWHPVAWSHDVADRPVAATLLDEDRSRPR